MHETERASLATGLSADFASSGAAVVVMRSDGSRVDRLPFDYDKVVSGNPGQSNFYVRAGDIVLVP